MTDGARLPGVGEDCGAEEDEVLLGGKIDDMIDSVLTLRLISPLRKRNPL